MRIKAPFAWLAADASAARAAGRPAYPSPLIRQVVERCAITRMHRVLDLGCGPGQLAIAFAPWVQEVVAIDPEPEMVRIARDEAARAGVVVTLLEGSSFDLGPSLGRFHLVSIGRAFHWMDRAATLARLETMVDPSGAVVLFGDRHPEVPENRWHAEYERLLEQYTVTDAERTIRKSPGWVPHLTVLLDSAFGQLERVSVIERRRTPVGRFIDRALSRSVTSRARLGDRADELIRGIEALMTRFAESGLVTEVVELEVLMARRPGAAG